MTPPASAIQTSGCGRNVLFIHGTGCDKSMWSVAATRLTHRIRAIAYDRRGTRRWPVGSYACRPLVADHAADARDIIEGAGSGPMPVCGISFGAVVALELMKQRPDLVTHAVLFEPALSGDDAVTSVPRDLLEAFEASVERQAPEQGAELFYRRVLGADVWDRLPDVARRDALGEWQHVRFDLLANASYRVNYPELQCVQTPVLLLQGGRSRQVFEPALRRLATALPCAQRARVGRAEHLPRGDSWYEFADLLATFIGA